MALVERKIILDYALKIYPNKNFCSKFEEEVFKLSDNYKKYAYEKLGELEYIIKNTTKPNQTKRLNRFLEYLNDPGEDISNNKLWSSETYLYFKNRKAYGISFQLLDEVKLVKCEFPCRNKKCKSDQCYFYTEQTRSGDEGATCFIICEKCRSRYRFN